MHIGIFVEQCTLLNAE